MNTITNQPNWMAAHRQSHFSPAFWFLEPNRRHALKVLYAVCRALDDAVDVKNDNPAGFLNDWRRVFQEKNFSSVALHGQENLAKEFLAIVETFHIPLSIMEDMIDKGVAVDLQKNRFGTPMETESYCYGVAGTVGLACLPIFGVPIEEAKDFAIRLGISIQWINLIRDVGVDAKLGRFYLPLDHLEQFGYTTEEAFAGKNSAEFQSLMAYEATVARGHYKRAMDLMPLKWKKELLPARMMGRIYMALLAKIEKQKFPVLTQKITLNFIEKAWVAFMTLKEKI